MSVYQIVPFQIILILGLRTSSKFISVNWICPNKFSPSFSLQAFPLGWADCWAHTSEVQRRSHSNTNTFCRKSNNFTCMFAISHQCFLLRLQSIHNCFFLFLSLPPPQHSTQAQQQTSQARTLKAALQSSFLPSYHLCPYSTPPGYLHFSCSVVIIIRQEQGIKAFCNAS